MTQLSTQGYKGTRDFYPEDMRVQRHIYKVWRRVCEQYGYEEYDAPLLESTDLYRAKTGEEIVNDQMYSFIDRGGRDVTIRPEMTPSVARMVAARQQSLNLPLRWYSIPNVWRYERPQHGRLREHWQLNVDIFGADNVTAELEVIRLAHSIMRGLGASDDMFSIRLNSRELMSYIFGEYLEVNVDVAQRIGKLLDRKGKMAEEAFINQADTILGEKLSPFLELMKATRLQDLPDALRDSEPAKELRSLATKLHEHSVSNIQFDMTIQRGFDYYTGVVFEIFDSNPDNNRSLFGGGRYDDLLSVFQAQPVPAVGFGMGDVGTANFLYAHQLMPKFKSNINLAVLSVDANQFDEVEKLASRFRSHNLNVMTDPSDRKLGAKIKTADKKDIEYVVTVGQDEIESGIFTIKRLDDGYERKGSVDELVAWVKASVLE